jgi:hypothetical protein
MANTLTNLIGPLYKALDTVSRELVGAIPCAALDSDVSGAAMGQLITSFNTPQVTASDVVSGQLPPNDGDQVIGNTQLTITKSRRVPFLWNGEQTRGVNRSGNGVNAIKNDQMTQAIRTLVNEMEVDLIRAAVVASSRAWGTAGTTPFSTSTAETAQVRKILDDNGAPLSERCMIIDTSAGASLRSLLQLTRVSEAGTDMTLRSGELLDLNGLSIHESAGIRAATKGTGSAYVTNSAVYAVGATDIALVTGSGTVLAGDVVTFAGDNNKYIVAVGVAGAGTISLCAPGLRVALPGSAVAMTIGNSATSNIAFQRNSLILATRTPALPEEGDMAKDRIVITDPRSGISFEVAMYAAYRQMQYEVSCAWGVKGIKSAHSAVLLG